jgi:hypothetical protein
VLPYAVANVCWLVRFCTKGCRARLAALGGRSTMTVGASKGGSVLLIQVPSLASRSNSALVSDVCAAALRASYNAPQRER